VLVYAGAIMTLFVFVVMVLNRDEAEAVAWKGLFSKALGVGALGVTVYMVSHFLKQVVPKYTDAPPESFGTVAEVGNILFTDYLFAFEAVSVLLMIAVVAAVVVARVYKPHEEPPETAHPTLAYGPQGTQGVIGPDEGGAAAGHDDGGHH
jgi:NADH-quinone oxidoreductase subunit J